MIDPTKVPCAMCQAEDPESLSDSVICDYCNACVTPEEWIAGGINAIAGRLVRETEWHPAKMDGKWYMTAGPEDGVGPYDSFDEAVLDAYKHLMKEE